MSPPGRRRATSPTTLLLLLFTLCTTQSLAAVLGIDFGTLNLKAVLVKPGIPLEIVLTKDSKRKEAAAVAFKPTTDSKRNIIAELGTFPERSYGPDALALQGRMPGEVFPNLKPLLGLAGEEVVEGYMGRYPAIRAQRVEELGTTVFKSGAFHESEAPWSVEELLAMELAGIKRNAETMAGKGTVVEDAVVTVPAFYTADERRAIEKAADLAGLNVMALISDGLAVGLDYAKSRTFPTVNEGGKAEHHIVFDMGAGSTTATLLRFQGRSVKDVGRFNKTIQEVTVLGTGWDRTLGGDSLNQVVVQDYIYKFLTKPVMKSRGVTAEEIGKNGRLMSRLWKDAEKARLTLSANTETTSSFEELLPEVDFRTKLSRTDFESLASPFADRVTVPIKDALTAAKLKMSDIDSIILHGGLIRTPFVQRKLEELAGKSTTLKSNVNADESAVFGAAFKAAALSPSFKVKEIRDSDVAGFAAGMTYSDNGKDRRQNLFSATSLVGSGATTKQISFKNKEDFEFSLYQQIGDVDRQIATIKTSNLTDGVKALKEKYGCEEKDVSTKFSARLSSLDGLPEIVTGSVSCETDQAAKSASVGDSVKDWLGFGKKKDQEPLVDDGSTTEEVDASSTSSSSSSSSASSSSSSASSSSSKVPEKPKKRIETITVAFTTVPQGLPQPAPEELKRMKDRLSAFDRSDKARYAREEALNVLEAFTYYVRDFLDNSDYSSVSTAAQRDAISALLATTRSWMEESGEVAKAGEKVLREKLKALKELVEPIQLRKRESEARPEKVEKLRESLEQTGKLVEMVREQVSKAQEASSKASELEAAWSSSVAEEAATATTTPSAEAKDDLDDDLDESSTASKSTTEMPKYSAPASFSPYTSADLEAVEEVYAEITSWLAEQEAAQGKLGATDNPVLTTKDLEAKAGKLSEVMLELVRKKSRVPPKASSSSSKKPKSKTSKTKKSKTSTGTESADGEKATESAARNEKGKGKPKPKKAPKGPKILKVGEDGEMPTEEEILRMVREAGGEEEGHDEL